MQELGTRIQKILQVNSRLKSEVDQYSDWVKNLEQENSVLETEKSWLESQVKAWTLTAKKYYHKIKDNG